MRNLVNRFGATAVLGQPAPLKLLRRIQSAEALESAYRARNKSGDWAEWASANPEANALLVWAMKASQ